MWNLYIWLFTLFTLVFSIPERLNEGDPCLLENGNSGSCKLLSDCPQVAEVVVKNKALPIFCVLRIYKPVVCCGNSTNSTTTPLLDKPKKMRRSTFNRVKPYITTELSSVTTELLPAKALINIATKPLLTTTTLRVPPCARHKKITTTMPPPTAAQTTTPYNNLHLTDTRKSGIRRVSNKPRSKAELARSTARRKSANLKKKSVNSTNLNGVARSEEKGKLLMADSPATTQRPPTKAKRFSTIVPPTTETSKTTTTQIPFSEAARIAKKKCVEYSSWLDAIALILGGPEKIPGNCGINSETYITGGVKASPQEFPHMAHLGYGKGNITFHCGASLISENFLLTAAHCFTNQKYGHPTVARLITGDSSTEIVKLKKVIFYPTYSGHAKYNDIGLIPLEKPVTFTDYVRPACIQVERKFNRTEGTASGWGWEGQSKKKNSEFLMKVNLTFVETTNCTPYYKKERFALANGLDDESMLCAGDSNNRDTCPGDSGGPIQIVKQDPSCMYSIVGITSFGVICGRAPSIYTRVSNYVPWIVSHVWPDEIEK